MSLWLRACIYIIIYILEFKYIYRHIFGYLSHICPFFCVKYTVLIHRTCDALFARRRKWEIRSTWQSWSITSVRPAWRVNEDEVKMFPGEISIGVICRKMMKNGIYPWYIHGRSDSLLFFFVWLNFGVYHGISLLVCFFGILSLSKTHSMSLSCAQSWWPSGSTQWNAMNLMFRQSNDVGLGLKIKLCFCPENWELDMISPALNSLYPDHSGSLLSNIWVTWVKSRVKN